MTERSLTHQELGSFEPLDEKDTHLLEDAFEP